MKGAVFYCWGIIYGVLIAGLSVIKQFDREAEWLFRRREKLFLLLLCGGNGALIVRFPNVSTVMVILLCLIAGCLLFACVTDCRSCQVFRFTWWIAGGAGGVLLYGKLLGDGSGFLADDLWRAVPEAGIRLLWLLVYCVLQEGFFFRMYGRADCHAFVVCSMVECAMGMDISWYFLHMTLAFADLILVQALRHNICPGGKLKRPVGFLPYITVSFWGILWIKEVTGSG